MENIKHIVYLMLENRSLDNVLGWLYSDGIVPMNYLPKDMPHDPYCGLKAETYFNMGNDGGGTKHYATEIKDGSLNIPNHDPHEPYGHVNFQLFGHKKNPQPEKTPDMSGFFVDYATIDPSQASQIMKSYSISDLPNINGLARHYAVSDYYFSSLPTQTNCNRAFAATGNSLGHYYNKPDVLTAWVDNHWGEVEEWALDVTFNQQTIWETLSDNGFSTTDDWGVYYSQRWPTSALGNYCFTRDLFWPTLQQEKFDIHFQSIEHFFTQAVQGALPKFSFLEPAWFLKKDRFGYNGNDYHPPANLASGEAFLAKIYNALKSNKDAWGQTLFIINFDEHGGTYDHVPPKWGAPTPWENPEDGTPAPSQNAYEHEFTFDRYGVRVPLILISPLIEKSTVIRPKSSQPYPFDHCSVIATILNHFGIDKSKWQMGTRVAKAPTFEYAITLTEPRTDTLDLTAMADDGYDQEDAPISDIQLMIAHRMIAHFFTTSKISKDVFKCIYERHFLNINTMGELSEAISNVLAEVEEQMAP